MLEFSLVATDQLAFPEHILHSTIRFRPDVIIMGIQNLL